MSNQAVTSNLGESIRRLRTAKNLTQAQLGQVIGVEQNTVSAWERGAFYPLRKHMRPLADALDVHPATLFAEWTA